MNAGLAVEACGKAAEKRELHGWEQLSTDTRRASDAARTTRSMFHASLLQPHRIDFGTPRFSEFALKPEVAVLCQNCSGTCISVYESAQELLLTSRIVADG